MTARKVQPPSPKQPFVDKNGVLTKYGQRFLWDSWQRSGGFDDFVWNAILSGNTGDAVLAEVAATGEQNALSLVNLKALIAGGVLESLQQDAIDLQKQLSALSALVSGGLAESLQQQIADLQQQISQLSAQMQGIRGEDMAYAVQVVTTTVDGLATVAYSGAYPDLSGAPALAAVATSGAYSDLSGTPTLATVATSGAYSDLSGTPSLGTVADEDTGTSGTKVPLLDGVNTWSGEQTFNANVRIGTFTASALAPVTGYITIKDAAGNSRNIAVV